MCWVPVIEFEERLRSLRLLRLATRRALKAEDERLRKRLMSELDAHQSGGVMPASTAEDLEDLEAAGWQSLPLEGEEEQSDLAEHLSPGSAEWDLYIDDQFDLRGNVGWFASAMIGTLALSALGVLVADLVDEGRAIAGREPADEQGRQLPRVDAAIRRLASLGMELPFDSRQRRLLDGLRTARNRVIHSLVLELPEQARRQVEELTPRGEPFDVEQLADGGLEVVEELGAAVVAAFAAAARQWESRKGR